MSRLRPMSCHSLRPLSCLGLSVTVSVAHRPHTLTGQRVSAAADSGRDPRRRGRRHEEGSGGRVSRLRRAGRDARVPRPDRTLPRTDRVQEEPLRQAPAQGTVSEPPSRRADGGAGAKHMYSSVIAIGVVDSV